MHKTHAPKRFDLTNKVEDDEVVKEIKRLGLVHEERVRDYIKSLPLKVITINTDQGEQIAEKHTAEALIDNSIDVILGAFIGAECEAILRHTLKQENLEDPSRISRPDILVRIPTDDPTPKWSPVDIKNHNPFDSENKSNSVIISNWTEHLPNQGTQVSGKLDYDDGLQLAHYYEHLSNLGLASPDYLVGIVGRDFQSIAWAHLDRTIQGRGSTAPTYLSIYHDNFLQAQDVVNKAKERNKEESIQPITISRRKNGKFGCQMCTFKTICQDELKNFDNGAGHVTLLAGVTTAFAEKNFPGIESIRELLDAPNLSETGEKARRRARAWITGVPELIDPSEPLEIPSFDIEVDIDLENSQALLEEVLEGETLGDDRVYLYGYGVHDRTINPDWKSAEFGHFANFDNTDEAEYEVLLNMWRKLEELVVSAQSQNKTIGIFHYSPHEITWWKRFADRYSNNPDTPSIDHVVDFIEKHFVDLWKYTRKVALRSSSYSIKHLAPVANFRWAVENPGGALSLIKYKTAINDSSSNSDREEAIHWLISYNRDDVAATYAVRTHFRSMKKLV